MIAHHGKSRTRFRVTLALLIALVVGLACRRDVLQGVNHMPVIMSVSYSPNPVYTEQNVVLRAEAIDEDGDLISFFWSSDDGDFDNVTGQTVGWKAPDFGGTYEIIVSASDLRTSASSILRLQVLASQFSGFLTVDSDPRNALILLNGESTGFMTPHAFDSLDVGRHTLSLTMPERILYPDTAVVVLREDQDTTVTLEFAGTEALTPPDWSEILRPKINRNGVLVFSAKPPGSSFYGLYRDGVQGGGLAQIQPLGQEGLDLLNPNWRATSRIFYQVGDADTGVRIYDVSAVGGGGPPHLTDFGADARQPAFSSDSDRMAFVRHTRQGDVYKTMLMESLSFLDLNPDADTLRAYQSTQGRIRLSTPEYSSDGTVLLYSIRQPDGQEDLYAYDRATGLEHRLSNTGDRGGPSFARGDASIFFHRTDGYGIFGATLTQGNPWRLGRPMRIAPRDCYQPDWGSLSPSSGLNFLAYITREGIVVASDFGN